ncbi:molecular chaperone TorD family protein [uncultured Ferrimonas sp.]|uniref:TorD/DmsD family molecular chaperone n=1 Tax=uncultured Ferrimonas sp. TaxID=432640 RepID=UPI002620B0CD|nr:molecular chaperone TorD family protein [uncultured Ferrimonas sp.]
MDNKQQYQLASAACGVLHNLYFHRPNAEFVGQFSDGQMLAAWPQFGDDAAHQAAISAIQSALASTDVDGLERDYYRLFIGPGKMLAYPWGSVYTDRENLLFADSCQAFNRFCQRWQVQVSLDQHQPLDHIGIMLGILGQLLSNDQQAAVDELLTEHLMPWAPRMLSCVIEQADSNYYRGFAQLTAQLLQRLMMERGLSAKQVLLYI